MGRSQWLSKTLAKEILLEYSLGHWCEVNEEIMGLLSRFEPPLEVEEKDSNFLNIIRNPYHLVQCSQSMIMMLSCYCNFRDRIPKEKGVPDTERV